MNTSLTANTKLAAAAFLATVVMFLVVVTPAAWIGDDAYITLRVVDNALNGYGLRWNTDERVQTYTNPLWLLINIVPYAVIGNIFISTIVVSIACGIAAVWIVLTIPAQLQVLPILFFLAALFSSSSFVDFATSGLEVPLILLIWATFARFLIRPPKGAGLIDLSCLAALAYVARMDSIIVMMPVLLFVWRFGRMQHRTLKLALGSLPAVAWTVFALFYYGFIFPNTKYAKLNAGLSTQDYVLQGIKYLKDIVPRDPVIPATILMAMLVAFGLCLRMIRKKRVPEWAGRYVLLSLGIPFYLAYVVVIGGDFMSGRFLVYPFFIGLTLLYIWSSEAPQGSLFLLLMTLILAFGLCKLNCRLPISDETFLHDGPNAGVIRERAFYAKSSWLVNFDNAANIKLRREVTHEWVNRGKTDKKEALAHGRIVRITGSIGFYGYYAGPLVSAMDIWGLSDALIARLPMPRNRGWRTGHWTRDIPRGYLHARETGDVSQMPKELGEYYKALRVIIMEPVFSAHRLWTLWQFQRGEFDHLVPK